MYVFVYVFVYVCVCSCLCGVYTCVCVYILFIFQIAETPNGSLNGNIATGLNGGGLNNGGVNNGGISPIDINGGVWNTQGVVSPSTPGFEDDLPSNGGYMRFKS